MAEDVTGAPERWAIIELMGHRRTAGRISEVEVAGARLLRVEIPTRRVWNKLVEPPQLVEDGFAGEQQYGGAAIYCLTPCSEEQARRFVESSYTTPLPMLPPGETTIADERRTARGEPDPEDLDDDPEDDEELDNDDQPV